MENGFKTNEEVSREICTNIIVLYEYKYSRQFVDIPEKKLMDKNQIHKYQK